MPSSSNYKRNYKQERSTAKKRGETGAGSSSGDATRHRARRKAIKAGKLKAGSKSVVDHKRTIKGGGSNALSNLRVRSRSSNAAAGGRMGRKSSSGRKG